MDSALAARSTASSFRFGGWPARCAGAAGLLPAVPLESSRVANRGRTTSEKPAPRYDGAVALGSRGSNQIGATFRSRKLGSRPRLCWPLPGLSVRSLQTLAPAVLDRLAGPLPGQPCALSIRNGI